MATEWLKVMLDEIARKENEARLAREEERRRNPTGSDRATTPIPSELSTDIQNQPAT